MCTFFQHQCHLHIEVAFKKGSRMIGLILCVTN